MEFPFTIGATMYLPNNGTEQVRIVCPVCFGKLAITVVLGNGEEVGVPCESCGIGFNGPRGYIEEWVHEPRVAPFVIAELESYRGGDEPEWYLRSIDGSAAYWKDLSATEAEAMVVATARADAQHERNMETRQHKKRSVKREGWTVRYHREQIESLERQLAWHRAKVQSKTKGMVAQWNRFASLASS